MSANASRTQLSATEVEELCEALVTRVFDEQARLSLTNAELADRAGMNRMTVQRLKGEKNNSRLSSFVALASAVGLAPNLGSSEVAENYTDQRSVVHRGLSFNRLNRDPKWRDTQRERAFSEAWERVNEHQDVGLSPILSAIVPDHTQAQATAAATVVQWLGSEVGFDFLTNALKAAGYSITDDSAKVSR